MQQILVTDCDSRKALTVVRSLGSQGYQVIAVSNNRINISKYSKFCSKFIWVPDAVENKNEYLSAIKNIIKDYSIDLIIPMEDETVELVICNKDDLQNVEFLLPGYEVFMKARDKGETFKVAEQLGINIPKTYWLDDLNHIDILEKELEYPIIVKPRISSGSRGLSYINNKTEFINKYLETHSLYPFPIIQNYINGDFEKIQVLMILDRTSKVKVTCTYQGIREFPVSGGPVTLWKTIDMNEIENLTKYFLEKINWIGFAEVEYIFDRKSNKYYLMEINPRFSANIALAVNVGIDLPKVLTQLAFNEDVIDKRNIRFEEYCQWMIPGDILNFLFNKNRFNQEIGYFFKKPKNLSYAILSKNDPLPVVGALASLLLDGGKNLKNLRAKIKATK